EVEHAPHAYAAAVDQDLGIAGTCEHPELAAGRRRARLRGTTGVAPARRGRAARLEGSRRRRGYGTELRVTATGGQPDRAEGEPQEEQAGNGQHGRDGQSPHAR